MKKIIVLFFLASFYGCATGTKEDEDVIPAEDRVVKFVFTTAEPNYDEVHVSYYDYKTDKSISNVYKFTYDNSGNAQPIEIILRNYNFRYIDGEGYRNNHSRAELAVKVFVDDKLVVEDVAVGDQNNYAVVRFNYDIGR